MYINNISHGLSSPVKLFADNMKVYRVLNTEKDTGQLQGYLSKLQSWSVDWQLKFNPGKCEVIRMTKKTDFAKPSYTLMNETLKLVDVSKDLGVNITSKLSWSFQLNECVNKANKVVGFLKRTVSRRNDKLFSKLDMSLVHPILEYCVPVWSPYLKKGISFLEKEKGDLNAP